MLRRQWAPHEQRPSPRARTEIDTHHRGAVGLSYLHAFGGNAAGGYLM